MLELAIIYKKLVQPYYVVDHGRKSLQLEVQAMYKVKLNLQKAFPEARRRILPTIFKEISEIKNDEEIDESHKKLSKGGSVSMQYVWLAKYCKEMGINDMEMSYEKEIFDINNRTRQLITPFIKKTKIQAGIIYKLNKDCNDSDVFTIYGYFHFPVFDTTKLEMQGIAIEHEFDEILNQSWFCLVPISGKPCGKCHPCQVVYREGLGWRLPPIAKFRYHTWPTFRKIAKFLGIYKRIKWMYS
jgi:hypothetical protein